MQLHAGGVPPYFQYPALAGCLQPGAQPHIIQQGGRTVPQLCNGGVKFVLQPTAAIPVAPPPPLCITSLVLTPVSGFQGKNNYSDGFLSHSGMHSMDYAVARCQFVCLSVCHMPVSC